MPLSGLEAKLASLPDAIVRAAAWRAAGLRLVWTNGCFDLLHRGHVRYLEQARALGDRLLVGVNSDASVAALKGPGRPLVPLADRMEVLAALASVDLVTWFDDLTPLAAIQALRPDVIAKGGDYTPDAVVGGAEAATWGGRVVILPFVAGSSTSAMIARARKAGGEQT